MHAKKKAKIEKTAGMTAKMPVVGIINDTEVRAVKVTDSKRETLEVVLKEEISKEAIVVTDGFKSYSWVKSYFKKHVSVSHKTGQYMKDGFHTNSIEGFWSIFKRGVYGIYHHVSEKHLNKYVNEFEYRYNTRSITENERFSRFMHISFNNKLKYSELIAN